MVLKIIYVIVLFCIETVFQILYYSVKTKFFNEFSSFDSFNQIFLDTLYYIGTVKTAFYLPCYLIFHLGFRKEVEPLVKISLYHALVYLGLSIFITFILPWGIFIDLFDVLFLVLISFISCLIIGKYK